MIKYAANAFLATKITFINEIAALCERVGADVKAVTKGMGMDGRMEQVPARRPPVMAARVSPRIPARSPASGRTTLRAPAHRGNRHRP